jgi:putative ATP-dependent endonuclease of OLD family
MRIKTLHTKNFRSLEDLTVHFGTHYFAIGGANDAGKSNIVRALRAFLQEETDAFIFHESDGLSNDTDYPKWKRPSDSAPIIIAATLSIDPILDAGLHQSIVAHMGTNTTGQFDLTVSITHDSAGKSHVSASTDEKQLDPIKAQEVLKRIQTGNAILIHNSTTRYPRARFRSAGVLRDVGQEHQTRIKAASKQLQKAFQKVAHEYQQELEKLIGRLGNKYKVGLSLPTLDIDTLPFDITLGQKDHDIPLDNWGSGTQNRTLILLSLFRARQLSESAPSAAKVTPTIIVEEPESFLHPAAQADFGRVLQDLASEFNVQTIVTTHSPYLLSKDSPSSNLLLRRRQHYNKARDTEIVDTSGAQWIQPFVDCLGLNSDDVSSWQHLIATTAQDVILVEGATDAAYFELLKKEEHGNGRLRFKGEIISFDGTGQLHNTVLLRFITNRARRLFVTFDLDSCAAIEKQLTSIGMQRNHDFIPIGHDKPGRRCIEGILPDHVVKTVHAEHHDIVLASQSDRKEERNLRVTS